ncbi:hypothetical protein B484DRAFT_484835 [Ochromonadaceae sp. CCMP2298]|nr:hypothetical protein B484DRAFT_484835 [Ochromonadaceae sp. CCMP2298]|mmetsp:Transcript_8598/g.18891  ORF Transcript_8598/g.18891 Transcript_8598/m.18891 type:complete len:167 (-) Transcript_8598:110-610(-)|eukprot:CAMPEP_0173186064 /NCGR_PEP_ID=MMETSP1141-20130122/9920_1 /TAXON_ID=483371 /ORGANISM="non described non described, Strain CCMP2298" /LENGTH=166 /DNA_ID=CAMNT_0014109697 /DNA_START=114 /DNA_END=614 /DNA_ORIENTATION=-
MDVTPSIDKRAIQLQAVFDKVISTSMEATGESDVKDCFAELSHQMGSNLQSSFQTMMSNTEAKMQHSYKKICELQVLEEVLRNSVASSDGASAPLDGLVSSAKSAEKETLRAAIGQLEGDVRQAKDSLDRLKSAIHIEIASANEECNKMMAAAAHCGQPTAGSSNS